MRIVLLVMVMVVLFAQVAAADVVVTNQEKDAEGAMKEIQTSSATWGWFGAALGAGMVVAGAAFGIGRIGAASVEGVARQPTASGDIRGNMIITAAMIEGVALFGVVVCLLAIVLKN